MNMFAIFWDVVKVKRDLNENLISSHFHIFLFLWALIKTNKTALKDARIAHLLSHIALAVSFYFRLLVVCFLHQHKWMQWNATYSTIFQSPSSFANPFLRFIDNWKHLTTQNIWNQLVLQAKFHFFYWNCNLNFWMKNAYKKHVDWFTQFITIPHYSK